MKIKVRGVALVITNPVGEILILQEFEHKPHLGKFFGMFSIPMETSLPGEDDDSALRRLLEEEVPGLAVTISLKIGTYLITPTVLVTLYTGEVNTTQLPAKAPEEEVGGHQWKIPKDAQGLWLRQGAAEMLEDYTEGKISVHQRACRPIVL